MKTLNGSGVFRSIFCHCKVGHFIVGKLTGVLSSLLASSPCMASEASRERTVRATRRADLLKKKLNTISWKMSHHQVILIYDIPGWPAVNVCCTFKNAMLTEIGKVIITPFSGEKHDHSLLLWLVNDFWGLCGCIFTAQFGSQSRGTYKLANQNSEKGLPGKHCHSKSHRVCRV